jgi:cyclophilin family peptidyl-prolyl cis-trans isomerase
MVAPSQAKRHLSTPSSRSQRSSTRAVAVLLLGTLGILAIGGFLVSKSFRSNTVSLTVEDGIAADHKKASSLTNEKILKFNERDKEASPLTSEKSLRSPVGKETLLLTTEHGTIRIELRPDLSLESLEYIRELVQSGTCDRCNLYRAEKGVLLQGVMAFPDATTNVTKGKCPPEYKNAKPVECPAHDPNCGCHGPTMTTGMVGWAGGGTGPDFFIDSVPTPATFWGQWHTLFGEIKDDASFAVIDKIYALPVHTAGMILLDKKVDFTLALE